MAMQGSVDFVIQAKDLTSKPTQDIVSALQRLNQAQQAASGSMASAADASEKYEEVQRTLLSVIAELDKRIADTSKFEKNKEVMSDLSKSIEAAKNTYKDLTTQLLAAQTAGNKSVTKGTQDDLRSLSKEIDALTRQYQALDREQTRTLNRAGNQGTNLNDTLGSQASLGAARNAAQGTFDANQTTQLAQRAAAEQQRVNDQLEVEKRRQMQETADFQKQLDDAADRNRRNQYEQEYLKLLEDQDKQLSLQAELDELIAGHIAEQAKQQELAAASLAKYQQLGDKALTTLNAGQQGRAGQTSSAASVSNSASAAVQSALNPLAQQTSTLTGIEAALSAVQTEIEEVGNSSLSTKAKIDALKDSEDKLSVVSKGLASQATLIDTLNRQNVATDAAKQKLADMEAEVARLALSIKSAATVDDQLAASLVLAQQRLQGAAQGAKTQSDALDRIKASATAAGVNINNLAGEEDRLAAAARQTAEAQRAAADGIDGAGASAGGFSKALDTLSGSGRTSLSYFQRIRGEVLSLTASFIGIQAAAGAFGSVLDSVKTDQSVRAQIAQVTDTTKAATDQYAFLRQEAERTAFSFDTISTSYSKIARQAKEYGLTQQTVNKTFADTLTVARSFNLSEDQINNVFVALGQIFDKGTIQAEEFKGQLGDAGLSGLFPTLAKVMQEQGIKSVNDLNQAMKNGKVSAAELIPLFDQLAKNSGKAFNQNIDGYSAQLGRFKTQLYDTSLLFANSGFLEGVTTGLQKVSALLKDPAILSNLQQLGRSVGDLIETFAKAATNMDTLRTAVQVAVVYIAAQGILQFGLFANKLVELGTNLANAGGAMATFGTQLAAVGRAGVIASVATGVVALGVSLGALLDKIPPVHDAIAKLNDESTWQALKSGGPLEVGLSALVKAVGSLGTAAGYLKSQLDGTADAAARLPALEAQLDKARAANDARRAQNAKDAATKSTDPRFAGVTSSSENVTAAQSQRDADAAAEVLVKTTSDAVQSANKEKDKLNQEANAKELKTRKDFLGVYMQQEQDSIAQLDRSINALQAADQTKQVKDQLAATQQAKSDLLAGVQAKADADFDKIAQQQGQKNAQQTATFENQREQAHERTNSQIAEADARLAKLTAKAQDDSLAAREAAVVAQIASERTRIDKATADNNKLIAQGTKLGADVSPLQQDNAALQNQRDKLDTEQKIALQLADQKFQLDEQDKAEQKIKDRLQIRSQLLDAIAVQQKAGSISQDEADAAVRQVNSNTLDGSTGVNSDIDKLIAQKQALIETNILAGNSETDFNQKLEQQQIELQSLQASLEKTRPGISKFATDLNEIVGKDLSQGFSSIVTEIGNAAKGMESWGDAAKNAGDIILNTIADILEQLAVYIIKRQIINALEREEAVLSKGADGGGILGGVLKGVIGGISGGSSAHTGAIVGQGGIGGSTPRNVNTSWFANAPRMHSGGVPGLAPDEYPTILQKNEEVLAANNPRNILNVGKNNSSQIGSPGSGGTDVHFHADVPSFFNAGLNSKQGKTQMFAFFSANSNGIKKLLG